MDGVLFALTLVTALGCGAMGGVFFAFSGFVMQGLRRLPAAQGIAAMQSINVTAVTPAFMGALFGTALACIALIVAGLTMLDEPFAPYLVGGGGLYVVGTIALTIAYHVPRNDALAKVDPQSAGAASTWTRYDAEWTAGNHVRAAAALAAATALAVALHLG
jgi:uncharacterized membrane protein